MTTFPHCKILIVLYVDFEFVFIIYFSFFIFYLINWISEKLLAQAIYAYENCQTQQKKSDVNKYPVPLSPVLVWK